MSKPLPSNDLFNEELQEYVSYRFDILDQSHLPCVTFLDPLEGQRWVFLSRRDGH